MARALDPELLAEARRIQVRADLGEAQPVGLQGEVSEPADVAGHLPVGG